MLKLQRIVRLLVGIGALTAFLGCAATQTHRSTGEYVDDTAITAKVKTEIFKEDSLKSMQIEVKTYNGVVQLSGFVNSAESVRKAGEVARSVEHVKEVKNDLIVK